MNKLYTIIKAIRTAKGITQEEIAEKLSMTQGNYTRLERGQTQLTIERLENIADIFEMSVEAILNYNKENPIDFKEDVEYYFKYSQKLEKTIENLKKQIEEYDESSTDDYRKYNSEIDILKAKNKVLVEKIKQLEESISEKLAHKDLIIQEKEKTIEDKMKMIEMQERTINILQGKS
ncbi:helix-turn-helix domain-containing protein [Lacihabitans sp. CCS-44]|uniref:helix-turn-helix domain-containing protein n=1 Tax=Lacihabitans sp. CCS-44 TaxID=2487331 RepID=UPI0020CC6482|nr:helix-turn-helix domain-containing protein [Lacihabitans sp. CCS-44]MCP9755701.1 helix-turn-helix domain-containing protein [Lacihabitans sp. CCS-44]